MVGICEQYSANCAVACHDVDMCVSKHDLCNPVRVYAKKAWMVSRVAEPKLSPGEWLGSLPELMI